MKRSPHEIYRTIAESLRASLRAVPELHDSFTRSEVEALIDRGARNAAQVLAFDDSEPEDPTIPYTKG